MYKKLRQIAGTKNAGSFIYGVIRLYSATFRLKIENESEWRDYLEQGGRVLICLWHQHFFIAFRVLPKYKKYQPSVMVSKSIDGDIGARVIEKAGAFAVRGSSSSGGSAALTEMKERLKETGVGAHVLDGPRGPAGVIKAGSIALAHGADAAIVPVCVSADRAWYLQSWDRFMIPKPFARVTVRFYPKIILPPLKTEEAFENQRKSLEKIMQPHLHF